MEDLQQSFDDCSLASGSLPNDHVVGIGQESLSSGFLLVKVQVLYLLPVHLVEIVEFFLGRLYGCLLVNDVLS